MWRKKEKETLRDVRRNTVDVLAITTVVVYSGGGQ
jgi:hypothetical protein